MTPIETGRVDDDYEAKQPSGDENVSRRNALGHIASGIFASAAGALGIPDASATTPSMETVNNYRSAIENQGPNIFTIDYDPAQEGTFLLAPSVVPPKNLSIEPFRIAAGFKSKNSRGGFLSETCFLPIPSNVGCQRNLGVSASVFANNRLLDPTQYDCEIVYSEPTKENPYRFPMVKFNFSGLRARNVEIRTDSWLLRPDYDTTSQLESELLNGAGNNRQLLQRMYKQLRQNMLRVGYTANNEQDIADAAFILKKLNTPEFSTAARSIFAALLSASEIQYQAGANNIDPDTVRTSIRGDCGVKAMRAQMMDPAHLLFIEGYNATPTDAFGGLHATNLVLLNDGTSFSADALSNRRPLIYPTLSRFIPCKIGPFVNMPESTNFPPRFNHRNTGVNNGIRSGNGNSKYLGAKVSSIRGGADRRLMRVAREGPSTAVEEYAEFHRRQIATHRTR